VINTGGYIPIGVYRDYFPPSPTVWPGFRAKIITSIAMMYDLEDPRAFFEGVKSWLAPDGVWVTQFQDLHAMVACNGFDNICHEHLEYYSMAPILWLVKHVGFRVVDATYNATNGGSLRLALVHDRRAPDEARGFDFTNLLGQLYHFRIRVEERRDQIRRALEDVWKDGRTALGIGASTKGNTTLQYCGITPELLPAIAERQEAKWGLFTAGSNIPIVGENEARAMAPDYFFVLPWHFKDALIRREKAFLARGGRLILPLPSVQVIGGGSGADLQSPSPSPDARPIVAA
jgi:NDP-4-keto-2,6-dideoxyhexose 3-C-methyltransferase